LDVGSGSGHHADLLRGWGWAVHTNSYQPPADFVGDFMQLEFPDTYSLVWCCHCLEHQRNPGLFLDKINSLLKPGGWLVITVPPSKPTIVGGHVSLWNGGLLLYHLVLAGFDCRMAKVKRYGYNVTVCVQKGEAPDLTGLVYDSGDIARLAKYLPVKVTGDSFNGDLEAVNW
jgi:SAM-dependent methyltransferase